MMKKLTSEIFSDSQLSEYMNRALELAKVASDEGEVPVGCVIVNNNDKSIISEGYNLREQTQNSLTHAELIAIDKACKELGTWRLEDTTLFVTLEPCAMCAGAIINSRIPNVVYGATDQKAGSAGTIINLLNSDLPYNHHSDVIAGIKQQEAANLLSSFFGNIRKNKQ